MRHYILTLSLLYAVSCTSQVTEKTVLEGQATVQGTSSKAYLSLINKECAHPDIIEVEYSQDGYIEVEYMCDGRIVEVGISNNAIIYSETKAPEASIPMDKINKKLEKKYAGWSLDEIMEVTTSDTSFLKVEIVKDGIEQNLYFTRDGKWFKMKSILASERWNTKVLSANPLFSSAGYNYLRPDSTFEMPELLREISGITLGNGGKLLCVQDELGAVFEYDLPGEAVGNVHRFTDVGDFEDLTTNKGTIYVLRSDGDVFRFNPRTPARVEQFMLSLNALNVEGLSYNDGYLYVACKDALLNGSENKRSIFRVKDGDKATAEPFFEIDIDELNLFATKHYPGLTSEAFAFNPSAVAVHPLTREVYVLSAAERAIAVYKDKVLKSFFPLPADEYYKPEGLCFYSNGDMLISNEGDKRGLIKGSIIMLKNRAR